MNRRTTALLAILLAILPAFAPLALRAQERPMPEPGSTPAAASGESEDSGTTPAPAAEPADVEPQQIFSDEDRELPLDLKRAIELAMETNEDIVLSRITFDKSTWDVENNEGTFDPTLSVTANYKNSKTPQPNSFNTANPIITQTDFQWSTSLGGVVPTGTQYSVALTNQRATSSSSFSTLSPQYQTTLSATVTQPLLRGFGLGVNLGHLRIAKTQRRIENQNFRKQVIDTVLQTTESYWNLAFAIDNLQNQKDSLQVAKDLVRIAENRVRVKIDAPIALTQAREGAARREEQVLIAQNQLGVAEDDLKRLTGLTRNNQQLNVKIRLIDTPAERSEIPNADNAIQLARRRRPEYEIARLTYENLDGMSRITRNGALPQLDASFEGGLTGLAGAQNPANTSPPPPPSPLTQRYSGGFGKSYDNLFGADAPYWKVSGTFSIPLGNQTAWSAYRKTVLDEQRALEEFKILDKTVLIEVRTAIRSMLTDLKRIRTTEVGVELAQQNTDAEKRRYEVGLSTSFQVLQQEEKLNTAKTNYRRAVADYNISIARYHKAVGMLLDQCGIVLADAPKPLDPPFWEEK